MLLCSFAIALLNDRPCIQATTKCTTDTNNRCKSYSRRFKLCWPPGCRWQSYLQAILNTISPFRVGAVNTFGDAYLVIKATNRRLQSQMMLTKHFSNFVINHFFLLQSITFCMMCIIAQSLNRVNSDSGTLLQAMQQLWH